MPDDLMGRIEALFAGHTSLWTWKRTLAVEMLADEGVLHRQYLAGRLRVPGDQINRFFDCPEVFLCGAAHVGLTRAALGRLGLLPPDPPPPDPFARERRLLARCVNVATVEEARAWARGRAAR